MRKVLFLFILVAFLVASSAWAADISGTWTVKMKSPSGGDESFDLDIKAAGENLTITCSNHPVLKTLAGTGTLKGDAVTMKLKATGEMAVEFAFTGKVAGNKITGTREISMSSGGPGGAASGATSGAKSGATSGAREGAAGGPPGGQPGGAPGGAPGGERAGAPPAGGQAGQAPASGEVSNAFTAEKK
jgi:hypothetical protein